MWMVAAYQRNHSTSWLAWSEGSRQRDALSAFVK